MKFLVKGISLERLYQFIFPTAMFKRKACFILKYACLHSLLKKYIIRKKYLLTKHQKQKAEQNTMNKKRKTKIIKNSFKYIRLNPPPILALTRNGKFQMTFLNVGFAIQYISNSLRINMSLINYIYRQNVIKTLSFLFFKKCIYSSVCPEGLEAIISHQWQDTQ